MSEEVRRVAQEARERAERAIEGPWATEGAKDAYLIRDKDGLGVVQAATFDWTHGESRSRATAEFIAAARSDVPALCDHIEDLSERLEKAEEALRFYADRSNNTNGHAPLGTGAGYPFVPTVSEVSKDWGERARAALSGGEGE